MKRFLCLLLVAAASSFLACTKDPGLSKDEARIVVQKEEGFPGPVGDLSMGTNDEEVNLIIDRLIDEGYINPDYEHKEGAYGIKAIRTQVYSPSEKGKANIELIRKIYTGDELKSSAYLGSVAEVDIKEIQEVVIDRESGVATVYYTLDVKPIEPLYSIICQGGVDCGDIVKQGTREIRLKKDDQGWRRESDTLPGQN